MEQVDTALVANITYTVNTGEKLVNETFGPGNIHRLNTGTYEQRPMPIHDGRAEAGQLGLETSGFSLVDHATAVTDFFDRAQLESVYYPEVIELVKARSGAARVVVFDHTLRSGDEDERQQKRLREVIRGAHNDYTEWSGPQRVRDLLAARAAIYARVPHSLDTSDLSIDQVVDRIVAIAATETDVESGQENG